MGLSVGIDDDRVDALIGLGVAVDLYDFSFLADTDRPVLVVQGENDEFGAASRVRETLEPLGDHITVRAIEGADHYFEERYDELRAAVRAYFTEGPGSSVLERGARTGSRSS